MDAPDRVNDDILLKDIARELSVSCVHFCNDHFAAFAQKLCSAYKAQSRQGRLCIQKLKIGCICRLLATSCERRLSSCVIVSLLPLLTLAIPCFFSLYLLPCCGHTVTQTITNSSGQFFENRQNMTSAPSSHADLHQSVTKFLLPPRC